MAHYLDSTGLTTLWAKIKALIPTSLKNPNTLTIQLNGTSQGAYDGSSAKTINVTKSSIGLGNVDNTADANKSVASATKVVATVTGTNSTELVRGNMADNDQFRILVGGTASNAGYAELATADDGSEPIYVRQYTGVFTNLARTATLLDGSGNTSFPGIVTASSFSGNLNGNATTATTANSATTAYSAVTANSAVTASTATSATSATTATVAKDNGKHAETASGTTGNAPTTGMLYTSGMYMTQNYGDDTTPASYGNIINVAGAGTGQLLLGWSSTDSTTDNIYYRSHRDTSSGGWGAWKRLAYATEIPSVPTSLKNPYALTMQANGTTVDSYDGSSAKIVNITPASIGAAASSHTHSYLPLSGGTVTGSVQVNNNVKIDGKVGIGISPTSTSPDLSVSGKISALTLEATSNASLASITCIDDIEVEDGDIDVTNGNLHIGGNVAIGMDVAEEEEDASLYVSDNGHDYAMRVYGQAVFDTAFFSSDVTYDSSVAFTGCVSIGGEGDDNYIFVVRGRTLINDNFDVDGTAVITFLYANNLTVSGDTTLSQLCKFSKSEAHFGVNGRYTDPYNGQAASFKFGGSIAATYGYFKNDVKANNIIVNGGNLSFIVNGTTYKLNMGKAVTLGLVTT